MYCFGCWANLPDSATTCSKCGRVVAVSDARRSPEPRNRGLASGAPLAPSESSAATPRPWLRILALGLALGLSAGGLLVLLVRGEAPGPGGAGDGGGATLEVALDAGRDLSAIDVALPDAPPDALASAADVAETQAFVAAARRAYESRDYDAAAAALREALAVAPEGARGRVVQSLAAALEGAGAQALAAGHADRAVAALAEAVELNPAAGTAWKTLGAARLSARDVPAAIKSLETAVGLLPRDARARYLLATVLYQEGETAAAVDHLRAAAAIAPGDARVRALLEKAEAEQAVERGFEEATTEHFHVTFEGGGTSEQAGYLVGLLLEDAYHAVGGQLDFYPHRPVRAVLYPAERFHDVTQSPAWAGALFDGKIRLPVGGLTERTPLLARVLAHEYTHAVVHEIAGGRAPVWLNEGLAQLSEGSDDGLLERFRSYVRRGGQVPSLRRLEGSFGGFNSAQAEFAYAMSLAATDYLVKSFGHGAARRILERLGGGEPLAEAIRASVHMSYEDLDGAWVAAL